MKLYASYGLPDPAAVTIEVIAGLPFYTEGPAIDAFGNLFFTNIQGGSILKLDPDGTIKTWAKGGHPNGQRILENGDHLVCDSLRSAVIRYSPEGKKIKEEAVGYCQDQKIRTPNDLAIDPGVGFYFTDSVRFSGAVYYFGFDGAERVVATGLDYPNGIALSANKETLFVAESHQNRILAIRLEGPGVPAKGWEIFAGLPFNEKKPGRQNLVETGNLPDGIALDEKGCLWVAHYGMQALQAIAPDGTHLATYNTGIPATSNLCFAGGSIYVTGGKGEPGPGCLHRLRFSVSDR